MIQETVIKCSVCGGERFLSIPEFKEIVENDYLRMCQSCIDKAKGLGLPYPMKREDHSEMLTYINSVRGVKDEH